jgi:hypothetical protein
MGMTQLLDTIQVAATARPGESVQVQVILREDAPADTDVMV